MSREVRATVGKGFSIDKRAIQRMSREIEKEFARHPVRVPLEPDAPGVTSGAMHESGSSIGAAAGLLLDWLSEQPDSSRRFATIEGLTAGREDHPLLPLIRENALVAVDTLAANGLVHRLGGLGALEDQPFTLTETGRRAAALQAEQRGSRLIRTVASRDAVLGWAYLQDSGARLDVRAMAATPHGWFCADQLSSEELSRAVAHLVEAGLVEGEPGAFSLMTEGKKCVENYGSVVEYQKRNEAVGVSVVFTGDNNGQLAIGNRDVQQNLSQDNNAKVLNVYARALREFAALLPEGHGEELADVASSLEREAGKGQPDEGWVRSLLDRAKSLLGGTTELKNLAEVTRLGLEVYNTAHGGS